MRLRTSGTVVAGAALLVITLTGCNPRQPWHSELQSTNAAGTGSGAGESASSVFSPDGSLMAFESVAPDLGPTDTNGHYDVYLRDMATGAVTLVSRNAAGSDGGNVDSYNPVFSPDGTKIAFTSMASDLDASVADTNERPDVYVRDLASGTTTLVSVDAAGTAAVDAESGQPTFSPDGARIAFYSEGSDLGPTDTNGGRDVYLRDLATSTTTLVSVDAAGTDAGGGELPTFSPDGSQLAFASWGTTLVANDTNGQLDVYVRDLGAGTTSLVSANAAGTDAGNGGTGNFAFSPDGSRIAFDSDASDLGPADGNGVTDVYLRDLATATTTLVSLDAAGTNGGRASSFGPSFDPTGDRILFESHANNLVPADADDDRDVYIRDLGTGTTTLVSANAAGTDSGNDFSFNPRFDGTGTRVLFESLASDLGATDTNGTGDLYLRDLGAGRTTLVSANAAGTDSGSGQSVIGRFRPGTTQVAFTTAASDLGATDTNGVADIYLATYRATDLSLALDASPEPVASGGQLTYAVTVTDDGPDAAEDTVVALLLPAGTSYEGAVASAGSCAAPTPAQPQLVTCELGDVADGATVDIEVTADVSASPGASLTAAATVRTATVDLVTTDNSSSAVTTVS